MNLNLENKAMTALCKSIFIGAMLLMSTTAFAEDAHHPAGSAVETPPAASSAAPKQSSAPAGGMMMTGSMMDGMMSNDMMSDGMMKMMMDMMSGGDGAMGQMMSPDRVEGRIAFLRTELEPTDAQLPLWDALAEALRANASAVKDMMAGMPAGMMSGDSTADTPLKRIELHERMLSTRLDGLRRLKAALEPFYATLDEAQKALADKLLMPAPMGMM
jgi:hypothetical protein